MEDTTPDEIVWYADLTHDGTDEKIVVSVEHLKENYAGEQDYRNVVVYSEQGKELWVGAASTFPHASENGIYLYTDEEGKKYILEDGPNYITGGYECKYRIFMVRNRIW